VEWINIKEKLPKDEGCYLCTVTLVDAIVVTVLYFKDNLFTLHDAVTHWMPLPEPPKESI
jgi:uncharacterized protein DUF551